MSQLSKKFPISDVLEKETCQELDEELALQIHARQFTSSKSAIKMQRYFSGEHLTTAEESPGKSPINNTMVQMNPRIFGKLKYRETKITTTALDQRTKQQRNFVREKKKPQPLRPYPFVSPQKLEFFKSHYPRAGAMKLNFSSNEQNDLPSFTNDHILPNQPVVDLGHYTGAAAGHTYFQPSFIGLDS